jgi:CRP-like cAMP-binding protein
MEKVNTLEIPDCKECDVKHKIMQCASYATKSRINLEKGYETFSKGDLLFQAGSPANGFYFLKRGSVRTFRKTTSGQEQTFRLKGVGDWLGFRDCMGHGNHNYDAIALESVQVCFINRELIEDLVQNDTSFQKEIFHQIAEDWKATEEQVFQLGTKQVHSRLAEIILVLDKAQGSRSTVDLNINREELASIIGMKVETLVRALTDLKTRNYISVEKNRFIILNREALLALALK